MHAWKSAVTAMTWLLWHCWLGHLTRKNSSPIWPIMYCWWDVKPYSTLLDTKISLAARGSLPSGANVFLAAPNPAIRSPIDILMVTTMALVWTVNSTLSWIERRRSVQSLSVLATVLQLLFHLSAAKACYTNEPTESVLQCKQQFARNGHISEFHIFAPPNAAPAQCRTGRMSSFAPHGRR